MSPSWNFPTRAEPSYEGSEPSRAKLGHFNFQAETELTICASLSSKFFRFSNFASVTWFESISWWSIIHLNFCSIKVHNFVIFQCFSEQVYYKKNLGLFLLNFQFRAEVEKVTSRTELKNLQLELWLEPALLGLITSISTVSYIKQLNLDAYISLFFGGSGLKLYKHIHHKLYLIVKGYNFLVVR